ncbi:MAG: Dethiobiotin synthetase [Leptolyngbyaceae cyanobacterium]
MDFQTARQFILMQTVTPALDQEPFIERLRQGQPPIPGQVTSLLLALKVVTEGLRREPTLERALAHALFVLSYESRQCYLKGQRSQQTEWPPMLDEDLERIAQAVEAILTDLPAETQT